VIDDKPVKVVISGTIKVKLDDDDLDFKKEIGDDSDLKVNIGKEQPTEAKKERVENDYFTLGKEGQGKVSITGPTMGLHSSTTEQPLLRQPCKPVPPIPLRAGEKRSHVANIPDTRSNPSGGKQTNNVYTDVPIPHCVVDVSSQKYDSPVERSTTSGSEDCTEEGSRDTDSACYERIPGDEYYEVKNGKEPGNDDNDAYAKIA